MNYNEMLNNYLSKLKELGEMNEQLIAMCGNDDKDVLEEMNNSIWGMLSCFNAD